MRAVVLASLALAVAGEPAPPGGPRYTSDGQLVRPASYREWIYLSSGLGMTYGLVEKVVGRQRFDNVFVDPRAYRAFLETGTWPDKTMFALEVRNATSKGSINRGGHYQEGVDALEIHLKDQARFPATRWGFFAFDSAEQKTAKPFPPSSRCQECHSRHGAVDETFVQFYPTLIPVARAKGTFKPPPEN
jgi:cytochrome P460